MTISTVHVQGKNARLLSSLRSGSFVFFTVKENKGNGVFLVLIGGKTILVQSKKDLLPGKQYRAEFIKFPGKIELRVQEQKTLTGKVLDELSLPPSREIKFIVASLIRTGLAVTIPMIQRMQKGSAYSKKKDAALFRFLAVMLDKNIPLTKDTVPFLYELSGGYNGSQGHHDKREKRNKEKEENSSEYIGSDNLKKYILRDDGNDTLLKYFNHRKGLNGNWLLIPLQYRRDKEYSGILKINLDIHNRLVGFNLSLNDHTPWEFILRKENDGFKMNVFSRVNMKKKENVAMFYRLKEKLHKKGIETDDISSNNGMSDGFLDYRNTVLTGVDKVV